MRWKLAAVAAALVVCVVPASACSRNQKPTGNVTLLVTEKIVPLGKAVWVAADDGSIKTTTVPADVAPPDPVKSIDEIRCLVPSQGIPAGTLLRKSMFVKPAELGIEAGITPGSQTLGPCA